MEEVKMDRPVGPTPARNRWRMYRVHGKEIPLQENSLGFLSLQNKFRQSAVWLVKWPWFDRVILFFILANALMMGIADYTVIDTTGSPAGTDFRTGEYSLVNDLGEGLDLTFTIAFTIEMVCKVVAYGFVMGRGTYLRNGWNDLDFVVVVSSLVGFLPGVPNVSGLRTLRVLRPLKSLKMLPGMKMLINSMLFALGPLANVVILLFVVFAIFGILGIQLFMGATHQRCRLTMFPVKMPYTNSSVVPDWYMANVLRDPAAYRCLPAANDDLSWTAHTSPWRTPQDCFWPLVPDDTRLCTHVAEGGGRHRCNEAVNETCGAVFDAFGNARFKDANIMRTEDNHIEELMYGYLGFDTMMQAFLTIFQSITEEGWVDIMYPIMDSVNPIVGAAYFIFLILFGSFLLLNLTLAVLEDSLSYNKELQEAEDQEALEQSGNLDDEEEEGPSEPVMFAPTSSCRIPFFKLVTNPSFDGTVVGLIILNTIVLGLDHHPMEKEFEFNLEIINFVLSVLFTLEMILKLIGLGPVQYVRDGYNRFDGLIVTFSLVELGISPPEFLAPGHPGGGGGISALRSFRLFRIFKLARSWTDLRIILEKIIMTLRDVSNFAVLLLLFMYILALVGMQFFSNRLRFDAEGLPVSFSDYSKYDPSQLEHKDQPQAHFDSFGWAFVTIFQVLSGENWNVVMYDCIRATGPGAVIFFLLLVIIGNFIILNLFLAILLINFDGLSEAQEAEADVFEESEKRLLEEQVEEKKGCINAIKKCLKPKTATIKVRPEVMFDEDTMSTKRSNNSSNETPVENFSFNSPSNIEERPPKSTNSDSEDDDDGNEGSFAKLGNLGVSTEKKIFTPKEKTARRSSTMAPSMSESMSSSEGDMIAPLFVRLQDGTNIELMISNDVNKGGLTFTVGQLQTEIFKKSNVPPEDQELTWKGIVWDSNFRSFKKKRLCDIGVRSGDTLHLRDIFGSAMFLLSDSNRFRLAVRKVVRYRGFDNFILVLIITSSVMLAAENPFWDPNALVVNVFFVIDIVMTTLFTLEMVLKMIAYGVLTTRGAYLTKGANVLDFVIVVVSIISLTANGNAALKSLRSLRTLRALRPLRMISRRPSLKLVVNALFAAIPNVFNVLIVCILFLTIFSIFTTGYMKGVLMQCDLTADEGLSSDILAAHEHLVTYPKTVAELGKLAWSGTALIPVNGNHTTPITMDSRFFNNVTIGTAYLNMASVDKPYSYNICKALGYDWVRVVPQNFDNVLYSLGALFELSTTEGWVDVMHASIASTGVGMQPIRNSDSIWALYWIFFIIVGSFFVMNLFVGVVIEAFNEQKGDREGDAIEKALFVDEEQKHWIKTQQILLRLDPKKIARPPKNEIRAKLWHLVMSERFEWGIMICIVLNTMTMGIKFYGQPHELTQTIEYLNYGFATIFTLEAIIKLFAMGLRDYFRVGWNVFDFVVVLATLAGYIVKAVTGVSLGSFATVIRGFRIARLFRLIRGAPKLRELVNTIILTLPALGNISGVLMMLFFIYAVMGVQLFSGVKLGDSLNAMANFQTFWDAILILMRSATGENWNGIMYELANTQDCSIEVVYNEKMCGFSNDVFNCIPLDGCGTPAAYVYYVSFTLFVSYVFLNLFIAVILEASEISADEEKDNLSEDHLNQFMSRWLIFDPDYSLSMTTDKCKEMLQVLEKPMGFGVDYVASEKELQMLFKELEIPIFTNEKNEKIILFMDTVHAVAARVHEKAANKKGKSIKTMEDLPSGSKMSLMRKEAMKKNLLLAGLTGRVAVTYTTSELAAVSTIQKSMRAAKLRKEIDARADATKRAATAER